MFHIIKDYFKFMLFIVAIYFERIIATKSQFSRRILYIVHYQPIFS